MSATGNPGTFRDDPEYVRARREIIRANHPDRGGSDEQLMTALRELDDQWNAVSVCGATLKASGTRLHRRCRRGPPARRTSDEVLRRAEIFGPELQSSFLPENKAVHRAAEAARSAGRNGPLPRNFPGARRYTETRTRRDDE